LGGIFLSNFVLSLSIYAQTEEPPSSATIPINEVIEMVNEDGAPYNAADVTIFTEQSQTQQGEFQGENEQRPRLFPSNVEELHFEDSRRIVRTYQLASHEDPQDINTDSFEREGWLYTFSEMTRNIQQNVSSISHTEIVEIETTSLDFNEILERLGSSIEHETTDGHRGVLSLVLSSIVTESSGSRSERFTQTETRTFPGLSNPDVSLIPHSITVSGRELTLSNVAWNGGSEETIDYTRIASNFTATAIYTRQGTRNITLGYTTTAEFTGELVRVSEHVMSYSAYFIGEEINPAAGANIDVNDVGDGNGYNAPSTNAASRELLNADWGFVFAALGLLGLMGAGFWFIVLRGNAEVYNLDAEGKASKVGRVRVAKRNNYIANLTPFTEKAKTTAFRIDFTSLAITVGKLNNQTFTANYGSGTLQHQISFEKGQKKYQVELDF